MRGGVRGLACATTEETGGFRGRVEAGRGATASGGRGGKGEGERRVRGRKGRVANNGSEGRTWGVLGGEDQVVVVEYHSWWSQNNG